VLVMGRLRNRARRFVDADGPLAPGLVVIGDAAFHSNPIYGRGCASALVQAALLDEALERHPTDLRAAACHLDRRSEAEVRPFWEAAATSDRRATGAARAPATSTLAWLVTVAERTIGWYVDHGVVPTSRIDPVVFRGLLRVFNMLDAPTALLRDPELALRSLPAMVRRSLGYAGPPPLFPSVSRGAALARLERAS